MVVVEFVLARELPHPTFKIGVFPITRRGLPADFERSLLVPGLEIGLQINFGKSVRSSLDSTPHHGPTLRLRATADIQDTSRSRSVNASRRTFDHFDVLHIDVVE